MNRFCETIYHHKNGIKWVKSWKIHDEIHGYQRPWWIMVEEVHEGDDENSLQEDKHHMNPQILSRTSKVVTTNSHETLTPWSCWIQNGQQPMCHIWLGELEIMQGLSVHIAICHDTINHHKTWICRSHLEGSFDDFW
jgi:hypothetical protein